MSDSVEATLSRRLHGGFHARLKQETRPFHDRLEAHLSLLDPRLTWKGYRTILRQFYGFYEPLEAAMSHMAKEPWNGEVLERRKVPWLAQDLIALGEAERTLTGLPRCAVIPALTTQARLLGSRYVVEGATLGGHMIVRALQQSLGSNALGCSRFFQSYGGQVRPMWESFLESLDRAAREPEDESEIILGARDTFYCFEQWLSRA